MRRLTESAMKTLLLVMLAAFLPASAGFAQETTPPAEPAPAEPPPPPPPPPETEQLDARAYYRLGVAAYQRKDYLGFLENMKKAHDLAPDSPLMIYNFAAASALVGNKDDALGSLRRLADMKIFMDAAGDADFDSVREAPEFKAAVERMRTLKTRVGASVPAFTLTQKDLITEGLAFDPESGDFFVSSVRQRKILRVNKKGKASDFTASKQDGLWAVLGLKVDAPRRALWACSSSLPQMLDGTPEEPALGALFQYDLGTGALKSKYPLAGGAPGHSCNDLTVGARGDVYVSDDRGGQVLLLPAGGQELGVFIEPGTLRAPQGLAFSADESLLFVADYGHGVSRIDIKTRAVTDLPHPADLCLLGVDGLVGWKGSLLAIQNGITPHRVIRLELSPSGDAVVSGRILEMSNALFDEPTLGVASGKYLYYIANSQWSRFDRDGKIFPLNRLAEPVVMKVEPDAAR